MEFVRPTLSPTIVFFFGEEQYQRLMYLLKPKELFQNLDRLLRILDRMSDSTRILVDLVVVAALVCLVAEEMNFRVFGAGDFFFLGYVLQAIGFVPAGREDVEGNLSADGVSDGGKKKGC